VTKPAASVGLARKLGLQPGMRVVLLGAPPEAAQAIRGCAPAGVVWRRRLGTGGLDLIFFWPRATTGLERTFARLQRALVPDGAIWAVMPKKAFAAARGVSFGWEQLQAEGLLGDLVDNKIASITASDYGTRFVIRRARRPR